MRTWTVPGYTDVGPASFGTADGALMVATHKATGVRVAIRYLTAEHRQDERRLARYRDQARRLAELDSPYVVGLYEYVEAADAAATVHEYVDGAALPALLTAGKLGPEAVLTVLKGVSLGLAAADAVRALDGFAADRVLVDRAGQVKLASGVETSTTDEAGTGDIGADTVTGDHAGAGDATDEARVDAVGAVNAGEAISGRIAPDAEGDGMSADTTAEASAAATDRSLADAVTAAFATLRPSLPDKLPKPLRPLDSLAAAGDADALLAGLDAAAVAAWGVEWEATGREQLARAVARAAGRKDG